MPTEQDNHRIAAGFGTGSFIGIIVALTLLAIGYLIFSANSGPSAPSIAVTETQ